MSVIGRVRSLHRYPVKSMVGEDLHETRVDLGGVRADRAWAVRNMELGEQQGARKLPKLLGLTASLPDGADATSIPTIGFPDGSSLRADDPGVAERVSAHVGKRVQLVPLAPASESAHYKKASTKLDAAALRQEFGILPGEAGPDMSSIPLRSLLELSRYETPPGTYFDVFPFHLLTTSSLRFVAERSGNTNVDARRYRPNLVIDTGDAAGLLEPGWEGALLEVGDCRIRIETRTVRCSIPGRAQAIDGIDADKGVVRAVAEHADRHMGGYASIEKAGTVRVGDEVRLIPRGARPIADGLQRIQRAALRSLSRRLLRE